MLMVNCSQEQLPIFVYGSLMRNCHNYHYLAGKTSHTQPGRISGKLFHLVDEGYPALLKGDDTIHGELVWLKDFHTIANIDQLEEYWEPKHRDNLYEREIVQVTTNNAVETAYVYYFAQPIERYSHIYIEYGDWKKFKELNNLD